MKKINIELRSEDICKNGYEMLFKYLQNKISEMLLKKLFCV